MQRTFHLLPQLCHILGVCRGGRGSGHRQRATLQRCAQAPATEMPHMLPRGSPSHARASGHAQKQQPHDFLHERHPLMCDVVHMDCKMQRGLDALETVCIEAARPVRLGRRDNDMPNFAAPRTCTHHANRHPVAPVAWAHTMSASRRQRIWQSAARNLAAVRTGACDRGAAHAAAWLTVSCQGFRPCAEAPTSCFFARKTPTHVCCSPHELRDAGGARCA